MAHPSADALAPRHRIRIKRTSRLRSTLALSLTFLVLFVGTGFTLGYSQLQGNIDRHDIDDLLGTDRPTTTAATTTGYEDSHSGQALNILVMGSDSREGDNSGVDGSGTSEGMRSDTTLIVHIPADRESLTVVSIPRDTLVDIPSCTLPDGSESYPQYSAMFNSAFSTGGQGTSVPHAAACTIKTVEQLTGILIDDFVVVDFTGFINIVDNLDGIPMYIEEDIDDDAADLHIEAGCRLLNGEEALGFARVRKTVGDGSDISRIGRQQEFMTAVINEVLSTRLLTDPVRLYRVAESATASLTTGTTIGSLTEIVGLAASMKNLSLDNVTFITMPFDWAGNRVTVNNTYAEQVWEALRNDTAVDPRLTGAGYEIAQQIAEDEAAASQSTSNTTLDAESESSPSQPSETESTTEPATDPASQCTRETAS